MKLLGCVTASSSPIQARSANDQILPISVIAPSRSASFPSLRLCGLRYPARDGSHYGEQEGTSAVGSRGWSHGRAVARELAWTSRPAVCTGTQQLRRLTVCIPATASVRGRPARRYHHGLAGRAAPSGIVGLTGAGAPRRKSASGDADAPRLRLLRLRQHEGKNAVLHLGADPALVDLARQRESAPIVADVVLGVDRPQALVF